MPKLSAREDIARIMNHYARNINICPSEDLRASETFLGTAFKKSQSFCFNKMKNMRNVHLASAEYPISLHEKWLELAAKRPMRHDSAL